MVYYYFTSSTPIPAAKRKRGLINAAGDAATPPSKRLCTPDALSKYLSGFHISTPAPNESSATPMTSLPSLTKADDVMASASDVTAAAAGSDNNDVINRATTSHYDSDDDDNVTNTNGMFYLGSRNVGGSDDNDDGDEDDDDDDFAYIDLNATHIGSLRRTKRQPNAFSTSGSNKTTGGLPDILVDNIIRPPLPGAKSPEDVLIETLKHQIATAGQPRIATVLPRPTSTTVSSTASSIADQPRTPMHSTIQIADSTPAFFQHEMVDDYVCSSNNDNNNDNDMNINDDSMSSLLSTSSTGFSFNNSPAPPDLIQGTGASRYSRVLKTPTTPSSGRRTARGFFTDVTAGEGVPRGERRVFTFNGARPRNPKRPNPLYDRRGSPVISTATSTRPNSIFTTSPCSDQHQQQQPGTSSSLNNAAYPAMSPIPIVESPPPDPYDTSSPSFHLGMASKQHPSATSSTRDQRFTFTPPHHIHVMTSSTESPRAGTPATFSRSSPTPIFPRCSGGGILGTISPTDTMTSSGDPFSLLGSAGSAGGGLDPFRELRMKTADGRIKVYNVNGLTIEDISEQDEETGTTSGCGGGSSLNESVTSEWEQRLSPPEQQIETPQEDEETMEV